MGLDLVRRGLGYFDGADLWTYQDTRYIGSSRTSLHPTSSKPAGKIRLLRHFP